MRKDKEEQGCINKSARNVKEFKDKKVKCLKSEGI